MAPQCSAARKKAQCGLTLDHLTGNTGQGAGKPLSKVLPYCNKMVGSMEDEAALQRLLLVSDVEALTVADFLALKFERRLDAVCAGTPLALTEAQRSLVLRALREVLDTAPSAAW